MPKVEITIEQVKRILSLDRKFDDLINFALEKIEYGDEEVNIIISKAIAKVLAKEIGYQHIDLDIDFENYAINAYGEVYLGYDINDELTIVNLFRVKFEANDVNAKPMPYRIAPLYIGELVRCLLG
jgi:hypothetical protein